MHTTPAEGDLYGKDVNVGIKRDDGTPASAQPNGEPNSWTTHTTIGTADMPISESLLTGLDEAADHEPSDRMGVGTTAERKDNRNQPKMRLLSINDGKFSEVSALLLALNLRQRMIDVCIIGEGRTVKSLQNLDLAGYSWYGPCGRLGGGVSFLSRAPVLNEDVVLNVVQDNYSASIIDKNGILVIGAYVQPTFSGTDCSGLEDLFLKIGPVAATSNRIILSGDFNSRAPSAKANFLYDCVSSLGLIEVDYNCGDGDGLMRAFISSTLVGSVTGELMPATRSGASVYSRGGR